MIIGNIINSCHPEVSCSLTYEETHGKTYGFHLTLSRDSSGEQRERFVESSQSFGFAGRMIEKIL